MYKETQSCCITQPCRLKRMPKKPLSTVVPAVHR